MHEISDHRSSPEENAKNEEDSIPVTNREQVPEISES